MNKRQVVLLAATVVVLGLAAALYWHKKPKAPQVVKPVTREAFDIVFGADEAPIQVYLFFDYFCSHCRKFFIEAYPDIKKEYVDTRKIQLVLKPVFFSTHARIVNAYKTAICLNKHGQYEQMHDLLLVESDVIFSQSFDQLIEEYVQRNSLFAECFYSGSVEQYLDDTRKIFIANRFKGTPTFVINNRMYVGYLSFERFKHIISAEYGNIPARDN
jgi:protein-disulfide isomerase